MTPVPIQLAKNRIRLFGGLRDAFGISRIGWIDVDCHNPTRVIKICERPALDIGAPGMFDDNGVILGDVIRLPQGNLRMYYIGFQLVAKAKFLAYTGAAESSDNGESFTRVFTTPILDRAPNASFINALHSILPSSNGYRAWISCGKSWEFINGLSFPQYDCWTLESSDGLTFDMREAVPCMTVSKNEYRIGRPRVNRTNSGYELRVTSDTYQKLYSCHLAHSEDGVNFVRNATEELPRGYADQWDSEMTCYPARLDTTEGASFLFYNGNGMGRTGVGVSRWVDA